VQPETYQKEKYCNCLEIISSSFCKYYHDDQNQQNQLLCFLHQLSRTTRQYAKKSEIFGTLKIFDFHRTGGMKR